MKMIINLIFLLIFCMSCLSFQPYPSLASRQQHSRMIKAESKPEMAHRYMVMHRGHSHSHEHEKSQYIPLVTPVNGIVSSPINHSHDHDHDHGHDHNCEEKSQSKQSNSLAQNVRIILASLLVMVPSIIRRKVTKLDVGIFVLVATLFTLLNSAKSVMNDWKSKVRLLRNSLWKHSTPLTRKYFFKNESAADRVTLLGIVINIILSVTKFVGGISKL